ncbi:MAG TPA: TIM-barrel domain-containing protein [Opitutaceae bacterium]
MPPIRTSLKRALLLSLAPAVFACGARGESPSQATVDGPDGVRLRVEALDPHVLRIWVKPSGEFTRKPSLAMALAPDMGSPVKVGQGTTDVMVDTGALTASVSRATLAFSVASDKGGPALLDHTLVSVASNGSWSLSESLGPSEHLLGLGQDNHNHGRLDRRGVLRDLWAGQQIDSGNVTAQYPVPFLLSTGRDGHAYGIFFDNVHRLRFDLGKSRADQLRVDSDGGEIDFYVIDGPHLADVIERYTALTGRPSLPPLWALGYWQSKCTYYDWNALDEAYRQLTARGYPVDVMVIDADWPEVITDYVWAKRWLDTGHGMTPAEKIADYAKKGVRIVVSQSGPMIQQASPTFASGWAAGVFATDFNGNPVECGYYGGKLLDFTSPKMNDWLWPQTRKLNEQGVSGWWLDLDEPEGEPPQTHYFAGRPAEIHNEYSLLCALSFEGVQLAVHPEQRPFILTRAGPAGLQSHHAAVWTGDIYSDYATLRAHPPEMLNSGLSGLTYWTCDTGGFLTGYYKDDQMGAHARLYERWMQFSAFSPITRAHKAGGAPEPYAFGLATEQGTKHYLKQRYRLLPYIYSCAWEASRTGLPIVRPLALEFPDDPAAAAVPGDEYMFGGEFLVAPVLFEGQSRRSVYFPRGTWVDWDTGVDYAGGREWVVAAPQNRIPVAVRAGAIIPMAPDMRNTGEKPWDPLTLEVFPSGKSSYKLYRDDGRTFAYQSGDFTVTRFDCDASQDTAIRLTVAESNKLYTPSRYLARLHLRRTPAGVDLDGARLDIKVWAWDAEARVLTVGFAAGTSTTHALDVSLDPVALPARPAPELTAETIDPKGEVAGSGGKPTPHFFPAPGLPATLKASNYDNGGEGVAFHSTRPQAAPRAYREDDMGLTPTNDAGGGYVLAGLQAGEWARYTVDCGNGGYFDLTARAASAAAGGRIRIVALDQTLATVDVAPTGGPDVFRDFTYPTIYLNPGEQSLLVYVEAPGFALNTLALKPSATAPSTYAAPLAFRRGVADVSGRGEEGRPLGYVRNLGRAGSSITFGVLGGGGGPRSVRIHYSSNQTGPVALALAVGEEPAASLPMQPTAGEWKSIDVPVTLAAGANRIRIEGREDGWSSVQVDWIEIVPR